MSADTVKNASVGAPARDAAGFELATGTFHLGIEYEGKRHYDFTLRMPTVADNIAALEAYPEGSAYKLEIVMYALCMEKIGEIPKDAISYDFLAARLTHADYDVIVDALGEVKKKLLRAKSA